MSIAYVAVCWRKEQIRNGTRETTEETEFLFLLVLRSVPVFERWCSSFRHNRVRIRALIFLRGMSM